MEEIVQPPNCQIHKMRFIGRFCHYIILYLPFLVIFLFYFASEQRIQPIDYEKQQETLSCNFIFAFIDWKCFICSQGKRNMYSLHPMEH